MNFRQSTVTYNYTGIYYITKYDLNVPNVRHTTTEGVIKNNTWI